MVLVIVMLVFLMVSQSTSLVHTEISQQLLDVLLRDFVQTFVFH